MNENLMPMKANVEVLNEMESLMILGGLEGTDPKPSNSILSNCDTKNETCIKYKNCTGGYCANCVAGCGSESEIKPAHLDCVATP